MNAGHAEAQAPLSRSIQELLTDAREAFDREQRWTVGDVSSLHDIQTLAEAYLRAGHGRAPEIELEDVPMPSRADSVLEPVTEEPGDFRGIRTAVAVVGGFAAAAAVGALVVVFAQLRAAPAPVATPAAEIGGEAAGPSQPPGPRLALAAMPADEDGVAAADEERVPVVTVVVSVDPAAGTVGESRGESPSRADVGLGGQRTARAGASAGAGAEAEIETEIETEAVADTEVETEAETGTETEAVAEAGTETGAGTETDAVAETEAVTVAETGADAEVETGTDAEVETGTEAEVETEVGVEAGGVSAEEVVAADPCGDVACMLEPDRACCRSEGEGEVVASVDPDLPERPERGEVDRRMKRVRWPVHTCADEHGFTGALRVRLQIAPDGSVEPSAVNGPAVLRACVEDAVREAEFSRSREGMTVAYPFVIR